MLETVRSCRRTGCAKPAGASLSFRYATRQVWVGDLVTGEDRSRYDLCDVHADATTVPRGWTRVDERSPRPEPAAPPPAKLPEPIVLEEEPLLAPAVGATTGDRYARLLADLRRLPGGGRPGGAPEASARPAVAPVPAPVPELAGQLAIPVPRDDRRGVVVSFQSYVGSRRRGED